MNKFKDWPAALQRRWLLSWAAGAAFLVIGVAAYFALKDHALLIISILLTACIVLRCLAFYRTVTAGCYEVVSGVCIGLGHAGLKRYRSVRMLLTDGTEYEVALDKRISLRIGNRYQLYFRTGPRTTVQHSIPGQALMDSQFLALSDMGEYHCDNNSEDTLQKIDMP